MRDADETGWVRVQEYDVRRLTETINTHAVEFSTIFSTSEAGICRAEDEEDAGTCLSGRILRFPAVLPASRWATVREQTESRSSIYQKIGANLLVAAVTTLIISSLQASTRAQNLHPPFDSVVD